MAPYEIISLIVAIGFVIAALVRVVRRRRTIAVTMMLIPATMCTVLSDWSLGPGVNAVTPLTGLLLGAIITLCLVSNGQNPPLAAKSDDGLAGGVKDPERVKPTWP